MNRLRLYSLLCLLCLVTWGCGLRPQETTILIVAEPGQPFQLLDEGKGNDVIARGRDLKSGKIVLKQKVNGWVAMPPSHWKVVKEKLNGVAKYETDHAVSILPLADVVEIK